MPTNTATGDTAKKRRPAISLVLPVYNGERYLAEALDSIFAQTFTDFELIAVDDCSTDSTRDILDGYAAHHANMRIVANAANRKLPGSLNAGFRVARGEWFSWTSDDNTLDPAALERLHATATQGDADIVYSDFRIIDEDGTLVSSHSAGEPENIVLGNIVGCCFLYRQEVDAALGGYDEELFGVEDYDFWMRAMRHGFRFEALREELYSYRRHERSLTGTRARDIHRLASPMVERAIDEMPPSPRRAHAYLQLLCRNPYEQHWHLLGRAFRDDPLTVLRGAGGILRWIRSTLWARRVERRNESADGTAG